MKQKPPHISVLRDEVLKALKPANGKTYVDGTFGAGGHTRALLEAAACNVIALDQDPHVRAYLAPLEHEYAGRFTFIEGRFGDMEALLRARGVHSVDGVLLDIGVSSMQIDDAQRGFSFMNDGPLDMRMGRATYDAAYYVNNAAEEELANVIYRWGDEKKSRQIARAIVMARSVEPITRTAQLVQIVKSAVKRYNDTINPATRTFQALRIWVNDELQELEHGLLAAESLLAPGGMLAVITFHSGEDAIVKNFLKERSGRTANPSRYAPPANDEKSASSFSLTSTKAIAPSEKEIIHNPRARSAKLRVAERTSAPIWRNALDKQAHNHVGKRGDHV